VLQGCYLICVMASLLGLVPMTTRNPGRYELLTLHCIVVSALTMHRFVKVLTNQ
jgi:hypothetical protein